MSSLFLVISFIALLKAESCVDPSGKKSTLVNCLAAPCDIDKDACLDTEVCIDNYCGGCHAICEDITVTKPATTQGVDPCAVVRCASGTICIANDAGQAECLACEDADMCTNPITKSCALKVECLVGPCKYNNGGCGKSQTCTADYCGGCHAVCEDITVTKPATTTGTKGCTREYLPVCCDGTTYGNECLAKNDCAADNIVRGACSTKPATTQDCVNTDPCIALYDPVCCDGTTYSNKCKVKPECAKNCVDGACVTNPCATVLCAPGTICIANDAGEAECVTEPTTTQGVDPCALVLCASGTICIANDADQAECVGCEDAAMCENPITKSCALQVQCVVDPCEYNNGGCGKSQTCTADYCGGCHAICEDITVTKPATTQGVDPCAVVRCASGTICIPNDAGQAECVACEDADMCENPITKSCALEVKCVVDPCEYNNGGCGKSQTCTADDCGGCHAICEDTIVACTKDAAVCSDDTVLSRSADLDCDFDCSVDGCDTTVCCDGEPMTECDAINDCEVDAGFTDVPGGCTDDVDVCPDGVTYISMNECCVFDKDECPEIDDATTTTTPEIDDATTTKTVVGCTEDAAVCTDGVVLTRSADLDCDFACPDDGCDTIVCCAGEQMTECDAINDCDTDFTSTEICRADVYTCPDGQTFLSRDPCGCEFDTDECEDDTDYCDARMVRTGRGRFKKVDVVARRLRSLSNIDGWCQFCLCSEVGQETCGEIMNFSDWDETNSYRKKFTAVCLENTDDFPALAADDAGTQCEWSDIRVKEATDIEECYCSAFYCEGTPNYDGVGYNPASGANQYGIMIGIGFVMNALYWM